jgi:hypothetical protein
MATVNKVIGGKKLSLALGALEKKITSGGVLRVGFLENAKYPAKPPSKRSKANNAQPLNVATVAFWNEFGTSRSPSRPFFRNTIKRESPMWGEKLGKAVIATGYNGEAALRLLGQSVRDDIESEIAQWPADNAKSTEAAKGFNKGLVDTGVMQRAVDYEVVKS